MMKLKMEHSLSKKAKLKIKWVVVENTCKIKCKNFACKLKNIKSKNLKKKPNEESKYSLNRLKKYNYNNKKNNVK
jgi:hypothetical protein